MDAFPGDGEVGEDAVLVGEVAADAELAAAGHRGEGLHFKPVLIELQRAAQLAEAVGQIFERERTVLEFDAALQTGIAQRAVRFEL